MVEEAIVFPLSFAQRRLWFLDQLEPGNPFYNLPLALPFAVRVNAPVLERSVNEIVRRHEALRTIFALVDGEPVQIVQPTLAIPLETADVRALAPEAREAEVTRLATEMAQRPFDLTTGPLLRAALVQRGAEDYVFLLTMHHIISDGWSLGVFWRELVALYNAFYMGRPSPLPQLPIQYPDYAVWQAKRLQGAELDRLTAYWRDQLADLPVLQLPTDRPRPVVLSYRGAFQDVTLPRALVASLRTLSQREGVTLFMTLLAAFAVLLQRYTSQHDVVVGTYVAGRERTELEGLIGFFVNSLVLRVDLAGEPGFRECLRRVREMALGAYAHQELPFEKLVEELQPERDLSRNPLFQVTFQLFSAAGEGRSREAAPTTSIEINRGMAIFDLAVNLWESADGLGGHVEYSTDLFEAATIERLVGHYRVLLNAVVGAPDAPISTLPLLTEAERRQLIVEWNATEAPYPRECVHALFSAQAARTPDALAVVAGSESLTYRELEARANRLAHRLRALGVAHGSLVAVCVERGLDMVVGLLAVLKADAAYVPLDPAYPRSRLGFMLADSGAAVLLTQERLAPALPAGAAHTVLIDAPATCEGLPAHAPESGATPESLCYVIYTSGSTGKPKGVAIRHRGLANLIAWHQRTYKVSPSDRATQMASFSFDACAWELWPYLTHGAPVHIIDDAMRANPAEIVRYLNTHDITLAFLPTPLAEAVLEQCDVDSLALKALLTGGDRLKRTPPRDAPFALINHYGPTECTVVTSAARIAHDSAGAPPIGRPIANTQVYVLDRHLQPVPIGVPGELHAGGIGLACGYHGAPELTAEKFIANPFAGAASDRLYKTGDLVRWRADGQLDYLGRLDHQVKLRGFRIEPAEIETVLTEHPEVRHALVTARANGTASETRLFAYVVPHGAAAYDNGARNGESYVARLRSHLQERLPDYMVPAGFVVLEALPQSPNGKIDRDALPAPAGTSDARPSARPRTPVESVLLRIWSEVLRVEALGIHDNFFELGGHSLLATQLIARIRETLKTEMPLHTIFRAPSIAEFASHLIQDPVRGRRAEKVAELIMQVEALPPEEIEKLLARKAAPAQTKEK
jgi:amino acid adenylation domain-containing protein